MIHKRLLQGAASFLRMLSRRSRSLDRKLSLTGRSSLRTQSARLLAPKRSKTNRPYFHRGFIVGSSVVLLLLPLYAMGVLDCLINSDCTILRLVTSVAIESGAP